RAFWSEYQNAPLPLVDPDPGDLVADVLAARVNRVPRGTCPAGSTRLTAFVDVHGAEYLLYWMVVAWREGFGGAIVDYGTWPPQRRPYFGHADANPTLAQATGISSVEGAVYAGLTALTALLLPRDWPLEGGGALRVGQALVD